MFLLYSQKIWKRSYFLTQHQKGLQQRGFQPLSWSKHFKKTCAFWPNKKSKSNYTYTETTPPPLTQPINVKLTAMLMVYLKF